MEQKSLPVLAAEIPGKGAGQAAQPGSRFLLHTSNSFLAFMRMCKDCGINPAQWLRWDPLYKNGIKSDTETLNQLTDWLVRNSFQELRLRILPRPLCSTGVPKQEWSCSQCLHGSFMSLRTFPLSLQLVAIFPKPALGWIFLKDHNQSRLVPVWTGKYGTCPVAMLSLYHPPPSRHFSFPMFPEGFKKIATDMFAIVLQRYRVVS